MRKGNLRDSDGLSREMRDAARDAARRSGMSLREWLDSVVLDSDADAQDETAASAGRADDLDAMRARLDALTQHVESLVGVTSESEPFKAGVSGPAGSMTDPKAPISAAPALDPTPLFSERIDAAIARIDQRFDSILRQRGGEDAERQALLRAASARDAQARRLSETETAKITEEIAARITAQTAERDAAKTAATRDQAAAPANVNAFGAAPAWEKPAHSSESEPAFPLRRIKPLPNFARPDIVGRDWGLPQVPTDSQAVSQSAFDEIQSRQKALNALAEDDLFSPLPQGPIAHREEAAPAHIAGPQSVTAPATPVDMFGLERHLRQITEQIEALARPDLTAAVEALRDELREIARTLIDAMPRQAIEALEADVGRLSEKIDNARGQGIDENNLATLETSLNEVRDTLRALTPIENLSEVFVTVNGLAQKIDRIGESRADPSALGQIEEAINVLRGIISNVASNEALMALSDKVHTLGERIEQIATTSGGAETLAAIEKRILALTDTIDAHNQTRITDNIHPWLESAIQGLSDKIDRVQSDNGSMGAIAKLETRIDALAERFETVGSRPGNLDTLERGLAEVLAYVAERREQDASGSDAFQRELARTQDSLEAVHETLSHVVDRLATLEQEKHDNAKAAERPVTVMAAGGSAMAFAHAPSMVPDVTPPAARSMPQASQIAVVPNAKAAPAVSAPQGALRTAPRQPDQPPSVRAAAAVAVATRGPANTRPAIDPSLPPDQPLEPGAMRGLQSGGASAPTSAAARIAASEAALGSARTMPADTAAPADAATKKNFIEAARRAAQAAAATEPAVRAVRPQPEAPIEASADGGGLSKRIRTFLVGAAVILLIGGVVRVALNLIDPHSSTRPAAQKASSMQPGTGKQVATTGSHTPATAPALDSSRFVQAGSQSAPQVADSTADDVTGSIGQPSSVSGKAQDRPNQGGVTPDAVTAALDAQLPPALGGKLLREAAIKGDAGAEYEIGARYAEGHGIPLDNTKAADWLGRAAKQGVVLAQFRLGTLYEKGKGVTKDLETARSLYEQAAEKGNAKAMHNLAVLYAEGGDSGKPDYGEAFKWFVKAANYGVSDSQYNLGILYARGIGVPKNMIEAYKWFALAAAQGDKEAGKKQDEVAQKLDAKEMAQARTATESWVPQMQPTEAIRAPTPAGGWDQPATGYLPAQTLPVRLGAR